MRKMFRTFALLLTSLLTVSMLTGCGGDDDRDEEAPPAAFVSANPPGRRYCRERKYYGYV